MDKQPLPEKKYEELFRSYQLNKSKPLKTLIYLYQGNMKQLWISIFFFIIKHSPIWIIPIVTANIIDITSQPAKHSPTELWINLAVAFVVIIQNIPTHIWHVQFFSQAVRYVEAGLRSTLVRKLQQLSITYHKELKSGKLQSKVLRDVEAVEFLSRQFSATILPVIFNIIVAFAVTISKSFTVALFFILTIPVSVLLVIFFRKNIQQTNNEFRKEIEEMSAKVSEMVEMIPVTRAHGLENLEIQRIDNQLERVKDRGYRLDMITAFFGASSWVTFQAFQLFCLAFTGFLAYKGKITVGDVVLYQGYFSSIMGQISNVINIYPNIVKGFESVNSIGEILLAHEVEDHRGKKKLKKVAGNYSFQNVEFRYHPQEEPVLRELNLDIKAGECLALVGESGAGKTTILNLIIGFCRPSQGKILLDGVNLSEIDLDNYRKFLAVVPQNTILFSGSIRENITYGLPSVSEDQLNRVIESANLREFLAKLPQGVDTLIGEHGGKLSGGQRQRIAIARALIRDPQIIVLDEATSALDNISEAQVQTAMNNLVQGRTTFVVAHRLSTIRDADRIAVIKDGTCAELGTYEELIKQKGQFYQLESLQA
jgi:ABC-type multidrug transport system, ATPase and permease components